MNTIDVFGPDKLGTLQTEALKELIDNINDEISKSDYDYVYYYLTKNQANKYENRLERLYKNAGWNSVEFDYDCDWEYETVKMTLRK